jgi:hypothetical protein
MPKEAVSPRETAVLSEPLFLFPAGFFFRAF